MTVSDNLADAGVDRLVVLNGSDWNGSLKSTSGLVVSTNADVFVNSVGYPTAKVATSVLLAEELDLAEIVLDGPFGPGAHEIANLLKHVGITLNGVTTTK